MDNKLEDVTKEEAKDTAVKDGQTEKEYKEITLKFGKGCVGDEFQGKDGNTYRQIMIPPNEENKQPWQTFVVKANQVHENQFGKGMWCKLPENGSTTVTKSVAKGVDENEKNKVSNKELKSMVEAYKNKDKSQENTQETKKDSLLDKIEKKALQANEQEKKAPKKTKSKSKQAAL